MPRRLNLSEALYHAVLMGIKNLKLTLIHAGSLMASRYSRIKQAAQYAEALRNLRLYEDQPRQPKVNSRGARPRSIPVYLVPFGRDIEPDEIVRVRNAETGYNELSGQINTSGGSGSITNTLGTKTPRTMTGFRPARVIWFRNTTRSVTTGTSEVTKQNYLKYNGDRSTCAFGRGIDADNQYDSFEEIKSGLLQANPALEVNRVSLQREFISYK